MTKKQKDKLNNNEEREGEEQRKRKRKGERSEFSFGAEKESRAKLDAGSDEVSGDDDNADYESQRRAAHRRVLQCNRSYYFSPSEI